jgi:isopentenyl-diphosphate delta-isomerase
MTDVVLVSPEDEELGVADKLAAHRPPAPLHRAFSAYLTDAGGRVLLQCRAAVKYHFAGKWANTCCGHPLPGEPVTTAAARRAHDELGITATELYALGFVLYQADDPASGLMEHELDHVILGRLAGPIAPDPSEVAETRLVTPAELDRWLVRNPADFAPWVALTWPTARARLMAQSTG